MRRIVSLAGILMIWPLAVLAQDQPPPEILGKELKEDALYLDTCRKKRNIAEYDQIGVISETEAEELLEFAKVLRPQVLDWLKAKHSDLM